MYALDTSVSQFLGFKLISFHPIVKEYFQKYHVFKIEGEDAAIIGCPFTILSPAGKGTMGITQYIKGFTSYSKNNFVWHWIFFGSDEERDCYAARLQNLLSGMVVAADHAKNKTTRASNPRVISSYI